MPPRREHNDWPAGLYDPSFAHDSCGVAVVATLRGAPTRGILDAGLTALKNLQHRGAVGAEADTGDGAGILTQIPDLFLRGASGIELPPQGSYVVGIAFLTPGRRERQIAAVERAASREGVTVLGWRDVPVDPSPIGPMARSSIPEFAMVFMAAPGLEGIELDRKAYRIRKRALRDSEVFFASLSARTLTYKGMVTTDQLEKVFPDLLDPDFASEIALVHSRFSTNTFPSWKLAQPFRLVAHNGEFNTIQGNRNWMSAREGLLHSPLLGDIEDVLPIISTTGSDTVSFDQVVELLHLGGRSLPHAVLMMIPEAWQNATDLDPDRRAFYEYHASLMEPWDGPAALAFTDGTVVGAVLDRNGLRPGRYWVTSDGLVVAGSEAGLLDIPQEKIVRKGRLQPGKMLLVDTAEGRIIEDSEIKDALVAEKPYREWVDRHILRLAEFPEPEHITYSSQSITRRQRVFGYTEEELRILLAPMAMTGVEPVGAMGNDTPPAVLSVRPRLLFDYFTQMFAQVTNPPIDAIREKVVVSIGGVVGPELNILDPVPEHAHKLVFDFPVLDNDDFAKIVHIEDLPQYGTGRSPASTPSETGDGAWSAASRPSSTNATPRSTTASRSWSCPIAIRIPTAPPSPPCS
jgi:glutamate synthase (NADPH/NADH) large chain